MSGESPAGYTVDLSGPSGVPDVSFRHPALVANLTGCDANNTLGHARGSDVFNRVYQSANRQIDDYNPAAAQEGLICQPAELLT